MPYAYIQQINHVFDTDHLNIYLTFKHQMLRSSDYTADPVIYDVFPPLAKWLIEADSVAVDAVDNEWIDEFTLLITSDTVAAEPTGVTVAYNGPDENLAYRWEKQIEPWGPRESFAGYPTTPAPHNSTHENGGADEINAAGLSGLLADTQHSFVDRGDPASYDYAQGDLTLDGNWNELDLSGIVPEEAASVLINSRIRHSAGNCVIQFRKAGNANAGNVATVITQFANLYIYFNFIVAVDSDRKIEYKGGTVPSNFGMVVSGWFL